MRTALLMLLVAAATFASMTYSIEYLFIKNTIEEAGGNFKSIGYLSLSDGTSLSGNVNAGAEIIRSSPHVSFTDSRRGVEGILQGVNNADFYGMMPDALMEWVAEQVGIARQERHTDAFFYGELAGVETGYMQWGTAYKEIIADTIQPYIQLNLKVDEVLQGYPEHIVENQMVKLRYLLHGDELEEYRGLNEDMGGSAALYPETPVDGMSIGQRYLLRGAYYYQSPFRTTASYKRFPVIGDESDPLVMRPLNEVTNSEEGTRTLHGDDIWFMPAGAGETGAPGAGGLDAELARLRHNQSAVQLRTTADMASMPIMQPELRQIKLADGRMIDHDDELGANPVAVVSSFFAKARGLGLGDRITVCIPNEQLITGARGLGDGLTPVDLSLASVPQDRYDYGLELEIVGLYNYVQWDYTSVDALNITYYYDFMYIPDSVLPHDYQTSPAPYISADEEGIGGEAYLPEVWFSFVLDDARNEDAFRRENEEALSLLGYGIDFIATDAGIFWESAGIVLKGVLTNAAAYGFVLVLALICAAMLFQRQRRKDIAIMRALGESAKAVRGKAHAAITLFGLPAIIAANICAWRFAAYQAIGALADNDSIAREVGEPAALRPPLSWLALSIAATYITMMIIAAVCTRASARKPVLEMLQSGPVKAAGRAQEEGRSTISPRATTMTGRQPAYRAGGGIYRAGIAQATGIEAHLKAPKTQKAKRATSFMLRLAARSAVGTSLMLASSIFFILAPGFLQDAISRTEAEIDRLYETIPVPAEIVAAHSPGDNVSPWRLSGDIISALTIYTVISSGLTCSEYLEATHTWALVIPGSEDGGFPRDWDELSGYDSSAGAAANIAGMDMLLALNDIDMLIAEHSRGDLDDIPGYERTLPGGGPLGYLDIEYADGYDGSSFSFEDGGKIPVIMSVPSLDRRRLSPGDAAYLNFTMLDASGLPIAWKQAPIVIIGTHNRNIIGYNTQDAVLMPLPALENMLKMGMGFSKAKFLIEPRQARDMDRVKDDLGRIILANNITQGDGFASLSLDVHDENLNMSVEAMSKTLSLLRRLYPAAAALALVIAAGVSMLIMLQNAKTAALIRVLGSSSFSTKSVLCVEQCSVTMAGLLIGISIYVISGLGHSVPSAAALAGTYLAGAAAGSVAGAAIITARPPMKLLQVKE